MKERLKRFWKNFRAVMVLPEMLVLPGQLAFSFILSLVPIIALISYIGHYFNISIDLIENFFVTLFGNNISGLIMPIANGKALSIGYLLILLVGVWIAANGPSSMIITSNTLYGVKDSGFIRRRLKAIVMTIVIVILFLFILFIPIFGNMLVDIFNSLNVNPNITDKLSFVMGILQGPISWLVIYLFIKIIYTMAPDKVIPSSGVRYGALFTSIGWIIVTAIYSHFIHTFANYALFYGGLANLAILMLWIYLLAYIFTIGMALNTKVDLVDYSKSIKEKKINNEQKKDSSINK